MGIEARQAGFTLIELVVVIVILGILAATALPKFIDLQSDAAAAATSGVAGSLSSAFSVNYAGYIVGGSTKATRVSGTLGAAAVAGSVLAGGVPSGYAVTPTTSVTCGTTSGAAISITVSKTASPTATAAATLICTG